MEDVDEELRLVEGDLLATNRFFSADSPPSPTDLQLATGYRLVCRGHPLSTVAWTDIHIPLVVQTPCEVFVYTTTYPKKGGQAERLVDEGLPDDQSYLGRNFPKETQG